MVFEFTMPITTKVVSSIPAHGELTTLEVICTDYQSNCKSNYHVISTTTAPEKIGDQNNLKVFPISLLRMH